MARHNGEQNGTNEHENSAADLISKLTEAGKTRTPPAAPDVFKVDEFKQTLNETVEHSTEAVKKKATDLVQGIEATGKNAVEAKPRSEIMKVFEGATNETRLQIEYALLEKAFVAKGFSEHSLGKAQQFGENGPDFNAFTTEPQIFFKPVYKTEENLIFGLKSKLEKPVMTDEVIVYAYFPGATADEGIVVEAVVKQKNGKIEFGGTPPKDGIYNIKSIDEVKSEFEQDPPGTYKNKSRESQAARGEMTIKGYRDSYKTRFGFGKSLDQRLKERDEEIINSPEHWRSEEYRQELMESLSSSYAELLQSLQTGNKEVIAAFKAEVEKAENMRNQAITNAAKLFRLGSKNPKAAAQIRKDIKSQYGNSFTDIEIEAILVEAQI